MKKHLISITVAGCLPETLAWGEGGQCSSIRIQCACWFCRYSRVEFLSPGLNPQCMQPLRVDLALWPLRNHQTRALQVAGGRNSRGFILPSPASCPYMAIIPLFRA